MSSMIPATAPFNEEQRAWLNGFFSGLMSLGENDNPNATLAAAGLQSETLPIPAKAEPEPEDFPWHDESLPIVDRMQLADGRALDRKMMAAMAQLNCGSCGYVCKTYAEAIVSGNESNLTLCSPGGKETKLMLKKLLKEEGGQAKSNGQVNGQASSNGAVSTPAESPTPVPPSTPALAAASAPPSNAVEQTPQLAYSRQNPFPADAIHVEKLTGDTSAKDTRLISLSISGSGLNYKAGDALGVFPKNPKEQVEALLKLLEHDGSEVVRTPDGTSTTLRGALSDCCDIKSASDEFLELMLERATTKEDKKNLQLCLDEEDVEGLIEDPRLIDIVARFRDIKLSVAEIVGSLNALRPRLYSIASSPEVNSNQVDLIVGVVQYILKGQERRGVASTFLANRMIGHEPVPVFVQPCNHFGLPADRNVPIIMVGPGTGVAPFRAFLHERKATQSAGENWLFFGDQHESSDFLIKKELHQMKQDGLLTRLSTAFSRDQDERIYVQNRMLEEAEMLWQWLQRGAHFYVCGDASRMAGDVDRALHTIAQSVGNLSPEAAQSYFKELSSNGRYQRDVY